MMLAALLDSGPAYVWADVLSASLAPIVVFAFVACIVWLGSRTRQAKIAAEAEVQKKLIDKFGSMTELAEFLATPGGRALLSGPAEERAGHRTRYVLVGLIFSLVGVAMIVTHLVRTGVLDSTGPMSLGVGLACLITAAVMERFAGRERAARERSASRSSE